MLPLAALLLPLCSALLLLCLGRWMPQRGHWLALAATAASLGCAVAACAGVFPDRTLHYQMDWFTVYIHEFKAGLLLDSLSGGMAVLVAGISLLVQLYSVAYMKSDARYVRYFAYLCLFTFAMQGLVLADNLFLLYFFWEAVGLSSYLLIGFWYVRPAASRAGRNAFIINRIGDTGLLLAVVLAYLQFSTTDILFLTRQAVFPDDTLWMTFVGLGIFCGAATKSAQFPMSVWLPPAMAGPTPVSALLHAATMVAAGVFVLVRLFPLFEENILLLATVAGAVTAFAGAFAALFQHDIKKVLAYSTVSQLGYMTAAVGVGAPEAALFHLATHAFFKAGLFLCAGSVIHGLHHAARHLRIADPGFDVQDMRHMGGLHRQMPLTFVCYAVCGLALAGLPLTSGFLSKDLILTCLLEWSLQGDALDWRLAVPGLAFAGVLLTALYVGRQLKLIFGGLPRYFALHDDRLVYINDYVEEPPGVMRLVTGMLAGLSVFVWFSWIPWEAGGSWFFQAFAPLAADAGAGGGVSRFFTSLTAAVAHEYTLWFSIVGVPACLAVALWRTGRRNRLVPSVLVRLSLHFFYTEAILHFIWIKGAALARRITAWLDRRVVDKAVDSAGILTVTLAHVLAWLDRTFVDGAVNLTARLAAQMGLLTRAIAGRRVQGLFTAALFGLLVMLVWLLAA